MEAFLASSPCLFADGRPQPQLNPANGFVDKLAAAWPEPARVLLVASDPDCPPMTQAQADDMGRAFEAAGLAFAAFEILDARTAEHARELVTGSNVIILAGGHVPTQNAFFARLGLAQLLHGYEGVVIGISAGTMNSAELVYAMPEEEGEVTDPQFQRFLPGLGLTETQVVPHYDRIQNERVDGQLMISDIACGDSTGRQFLLMPDGSYLHVKDGIERICGDAYLLMDGCIRPLIKHMCEASGEAEAERRRQMDEEA